MSKSSSSSRRISALFIATVCLAPMVVLSSGVSTESRSSDEQSISMAPYWNSLLPVEERIDDLIARMSVEEKAGQMFQPVIRQGANGTLANGTASYIADSLMTHFNLGGTITSAFEAATWANNIQQAARNTRLGIPVTLSSDPRHSYTDNIGTGALAGAFSQWPEALGIAALRDPAVALEFAQIAAEEYKAVGLRASLHPQVDLTTEPRWARIGTTFGESANVTSEMVVSYIKGFQGETFGRHSVTTVTKHFPGSGTLRIGNDSHFPTGKDSVYPGDNFEYHLQPFKAAIAAGARQMMPMYSRPINLTYHNRTFEEVGGSFNKGLVTDLLREELGFQDGIVLSDWGLVTDFNAAGQDMEAIAWGAESLTPAERMKKILDAGVDQFGGQTNPELLAEIVHNGTIPESRLDIPVRRILREKFLLGLFDDPFVSPTAAARIVGNPYFTRVANQTQRDSFTLLKNAYNTLPLLDSLLSPSPPPTTTPLKIYISGFDPSYLAPFPAIPVSTPQEAHLALLRLSTPYDPRGGPFERNYHSGSLAFNASTLAAILDILHTVPTIVDIKLERPAVIPEIAEAATVVLASYGAGPEALLDVVFGTQERGVGRGEGPRGRLVFDLPRSMESVLGQREDVPFDTVDPVFRFGEGLVGYGR